MNFVDQEELISAVKRNNKSIEFPGLRAEIYRAVGEWKREKPRRELEEFVFDLVCAIREQKDKEASTK